MAKPLLRSGRIDEFYALGENGQSIFELAQQIRETLRLRKQQDLFLSLAIPQINETNNRVNWVAPVEGKAIAWAAADAEQQQAAMARLERCEAAIAVLVEQCRQSQDAAAQLFAALLPHVLCFPGSQFVYLVGEVPVITFWGFASCDPLSRQEPLAPLRAALQTARMPLPETRAPVPQQKEEEEAVVVSLSHQPAVTEAQPVDTSPSRRSAFRPGRWALTAALLAACGALFFWPTLRAWHQPGLPLPTRHAPETPLPASLPDRPLPDVNSIHLPLAAARLTAPAIVTTLHPDAALTPNALQLPANDLRTGSTRFLDGKWRLSARQHASDLRGISAFRLTLAHAQGVASLVAAPHVSCKASVKYGLMQSGNLIVKSVGKAKCADGSRLPVPDIICNRNAEGATLCNADYGDSAPVAVMLRKVKE